MKSRQSILLAVLVTTLALTAGTAACDPSAKDESAGSESPAAAPAASASTRAPESEGNEPAATTTPARQAGTAPAFLEIADLPPSDIGDPWIASSVTDGRPYDDNFCHLVLPSDGVRFRKFNASPDEMTQIVVKQESETAAEELVTDLEESMSSCADRENQSDKNEGWIYTSKSFGKLDVEDGAAVYSVNYAPSSTAVALEDGGWYLGVGRDGDTVTLIKWVVYGGVEQVPVEPFKKTTATSVAKLYG